MLLPYQVRLCAADSRRSSETVKPQGDCNTELILYTKMNLNIGEAIGKRLGSGGGSIGNDNVKVDIIKGTRGWWALLS